jgi:hypothetical protein
MKAPDDPPRRDLVVLVADKNLEAVVSGLLGRPRSFAIKPIEYDLFVHPRRDPGCLNEASEFLRSFSEAYRHALVLFDHQGCGREETPPDEIADLVREQIELAGWAGRAEVVVLAPELEVWVWTDSPHVPHCLGWADHAPPLRQWLADRGSWPRDEAKPREPKAALEAALREVRKPRSSAIYGDLARSVSLRGHNEPAFLRLSEALKKWFGE